MRVYLESTSCPAKDLGHDGGLGSWKVRVVRCALGNQRGGSESERLLGRSNAVLVCNLVLGVLDVF